MNRGLKNCVLECVQNETNIDALKDLFFFHVFSKPKNHILVRNFVFVQLKCCIHIYSILKYKS